MLVCPVCVQFSQFTEAWPPAVQILKVLLFVWVRKDGAERRRLRSSSLIVKHQNAVEGGSCDVPVCSVEVLGEPEDVLTESKLNYTAQMPVTLAHIFAKVADFLIGSEVSAS